MAVLRADAMEETLEQYYASGDEGFTALVDAFGAGRDDSRIVRTVDTLYDFVRSHPFPNRWLKRQADDYRNISDPACTKWGETVFSFAQQAAEYALSLTDNALLLLREAPEIEAAYQEGFLSDHAALLDLAETFRRKDWDGAVFRCGAFSLCAAESTARFFRGPDQTTLR